MPSDDGPRWWPARGQVRSVMVLRIRSNDFAFERAQPEVRYARRRYQRRWIPKKREGHIGRVRQLTGDERTRGASGGRGRQPDQRRGVFVPAAHDDDVHRREGALSTTAILRVSGRTTADRRPVTARGHLHRGRNG